MMKMMCAFTEGGGVLTFNWHASALSRIRSLIISVAVSAGLPCLQSVAGAPGASRLFMSFISYEAIDARAVSL